MADFSLRAAGYEYMDEATTVGPDLQQCLRELVRVNQFFGGVRGSLVGLQRLAAKCESQELSILDLGAGAADIPAAMVAWAKRQGIAIRVTAVDFNPEIVAIASGQVADIPQIEVLCEDVFDLPFADDSFDIVHAGLFLHHFAGERLKALLQKMVRLARVGLLINDLHRHVLAYAGIRFFDALFSKSHMAKHDGPQSVLRGFSAEELRALAGDCGIELEIEWCWAFRWIATAVV